MDLRPSRDRYDLKKVKTCHGLGETEVWKYTQLGRRTLSGEEDKGNESRVESVVEGVLRKGTLRSYLTYRSGTRGYCVTRKGSCGEK